MLISVLVVQRFHRQTLSVNSDDLCDNYPLLEVQYTNTICPILKT
ncbi:hypothetical protein SPBRAN_841 [uncultured Candidatus Thioglobus sp.]|nr:hypothetical protein SPBRAN_841 [uncultured Candidatus Thioglobus sp.]